MPTETQHFGLTRLDPGEGIHDGDGHYPSVDRDVIDQGLYNAVYHKHTGEAFVDGSPQTAPTLTLNSTGGTLPAGTVITYAYTYMDPDTGQTAASPSASVTTPASITAPDAPTFTLQSIGGTLEPGQYFYALSFYQTSTTVETKAVNPVSVEIPTGSSTNEVTLTMPDNPAGATGFNIYRRAPGETQYYWIASTTGTSYVDGGDASTTRGLPSENTTNATYSVDVDHPGSVPTDNTWSIYRTYTADWTNSYLTTLDDATTSYVDTGVSTSVGTPPAEAGVFGSPSKVLLTDAVEVQGVLPIANGGTGSTTDDTVKLTGDQTIAGVKTFSSSPIVPAPTTDLQAATKLYVDTAVGGGSDTDDVKLTGDQTVAGIKTFSSSPIVPTPTTDFQAATKEYVDSVAGSDTDDVKLTGDQTVAGIKTFSSSPIVPTPTTDFQTATKEYVDTEVAAVPVSYHALVDHGATAGTTRPSVSGPVLWRGTVEPTNAIDGDDWLDYS